MSRPTAAIGSFPYRKHRTVAQWRDSRTFLWCEQCDARVEDSAARQCRSPFCKIKGAA